MPDKRTIAIATGTRADWGLLSPVARGLASRPDCEVSILATNMHLIPEYGDTIREIEADGFADVVRVEMPVDTDTPLATVKAMSGCMEGMARELTRLRPDLIVILGDRFEMLATATAALMTGTPIVHIAGGEISEEPSTTPSATPSPRWPRSTSRPPSHTAAASWRWARSPAASSTPVP